MFLLSCVDLLCLLLAIINNGSAQRFQDERIMFPVEMEIGTRVNFANCNDPKVCVPIAQCGPVLQELHETLKPIASSVLQRFRNLQCGTEQNSPKVCCPQKQLPPLPPRLVPNVSRHRNLNLVNSRRCGVTDDDKLIGGSKANLFEFPWMARLVFKENNVVNLVIKCAGSLINDRYVLTAAHCIQKPTSPIQLAFVRLGELNELTDPDCYNGECAEKVKDVLIEEQIAHPQYNTDTFHNDIGIIRLKSAVQFSESVIPICLPVTNDLQTASLTGKKVTIAGWGLDNIQASTDLMKIEVPVVENVNCQEFYSSLDPPIKIIEYTQMCAGNSEKDACQGDSGGPLQFLNRVEGITKIVQHGLVSYGSSTCGEGLPAVCTKTAFYMDWILDQLRS